MFRLYKRSDEGRLIAYHEAWVDQRSRVIVEHWGMVGDRGEQDTHRIKILKSLESQFEAILGPAKAGGFEEIDLGDYQTMTIHCPIGEHWPLADSDKREDMEEVLNEIMGWTGLGEPNGHTVDEAAGSIGFHCRVVDVPIAVETLTEALRETEYGVHTRMAQD